ncbi:MAG: hypothetical protein ACQEXX_16925 [Bacillota bacterium]
MLHQLSCIREMTQLQPDKLKDGDLALVLGYYEPGDISMQYKWRSDSTLTHNGGTVIAPEEYSESGRWLLIHHGVCDFRYFGIMNSSVPADEALTTMVNDPSIKLIEGYTDLRFTKRQKFNRSDLELDFHNCNVTAQGIEPAAHNDPFGAVMHFRGQLMEEKQELNLSHSLEELYDIFEVEDSSAFHLYDWWIVTVNRLTGREEKEIDKMLMVTEIIDDTHVRFNYKMGWELQEGRTLTYQRVEPVKNVNVRNMVFWGNDGGEDKGAQPLVLEYAVNCDAFGLHAYHTYWPVLLRRHNTYYVTEKCSLSNPVEVVVGGTGYLTQQIHCLYGKVRDCVASNARHLNDFTGSAYCMVENCHGDGDFHGAFVTHGQFEHDLTYIGNSGLISFANSGFTWGDSAKRITVKRHSACWFISFAKVTDLTLEDVYITKTEKYPECGTILINADGAQIRGCTADQLVFTQRSSRSKRPNVVQDCHFTEGVEIVREGDTAVTAKIHIREEL